MNKLLIDIGSFWIKSQLIFCITFITLLFPISVSAKANIEKNFINLIDDAKPIHKPIHVTIDITDDMWKSRGRLTKRNIQALMKYHSKLGITRVYLIVMPELQNINFALSSTSNTYRDLCMIVNSAHAEGIEIYAVFKPFETAPQGNFVPHFVKLPPNMPYKKTIMGNNFNTVPFVNNHQNLRIKRYPTPDLSNSIIETIKIVNNNSNPLKIQPTDINVWISTINGRFIGYKKKYLFSNNLEQRNGKQVRVITLSGLRIPSEYNYILLTNNAETKNRTLTNKSSKLLELYSLSGDLIPITIDQGGLSRKKVLSNMHRMWLYSTGCYEIPPKFNLDKRYGTTLENTSYYFDVYYGDTIRSFTWKQSELDGYIAAVKGKSEYLDILQPLHPEVKNYWITQIKILIDAGFDGIDIRIDNHSSNTNQPLKYGFGPIVVETYQQKYGINILTQSYDQTKWKQIQGDAYTSFLHEARKLTQKYNVKMQTHINALMGVKIPRWRKNNVPNNIKWQWNRWIDENIVDSVMLKYLPWPWFISNTVGGEFAEKVIQKTKKNKKQVSWEWRLDCWWLTPTKFPSKEFSWFDEIKIRKKAQWGWRRSEIDFINIYESFDFTYLDTLSGKVSGSKNFERILMELHKNRSVW